LQDALVKFACFNPSTQQLEYHPGVPLSPLDPLYDPAHPGLVVKPHSTYNMVEFIHEPEAARWTMQGRASIGVGEPVEEDEEKAIEQAESNYVALLVTSEHDMYVQLGNAARGGEHNKVAWAQTGGSSAGGKVPFKKIPAAELVSECACPPEETCEHRMKCIRFLACAEMGVQVPASSPELASVMHVLGLVPEMTDAFLELYGQLLSDMSVHDVRPCDRCAHIHLCVLVAAQATGWVTAACPTVSRFCPDLTKVVSSARLAFVSHRRRTVGTRHARSIQLARMTRHGCL
jgi:hypothetical protein